MQMPSFLRQTSRLRKGMSLRRCMSAFPVQTPGHDRVGKEVCWLPTNRPNLHPHPQLHHHHQRRNLTLASLPTWLLPPTVFTGLLATLWIYKCIVTVAFQEKIIYMPYMPPFTRSERIEDYAALCRPVEWREENIASMDGTKMALCVGRIPRDEQPHGERKHCVICYFHGNGGSLPPRLPMLSGVLKAIQAHRPPESKRNVEYSIAALSYRGYWTSSGTPSQPGMEQDAQALLHWVNNTHMANNPNTELVLWGQSIGAGVATTAAATYTTTRHGTNTAPIATLVLETPFTSIKRMLLALYPQKWLPYRYLSPFLRSHWDSETALRRFAANTPNATAGSKPTVLIVSAANDELVPAGEAEKLQDVCRTAGLEAELKSVRGALHNDATVKGEGRRAVADFTVRLASREEG